MISEQSIVYSVVTVKLQVSASAVIAVTIAPGAALRGVAAAILSPDGSPVAVFGGEASAHGSIYVRHGGKYNAVFGNTATPGVTANFTVTVIDCGDGVTMLAFSDGPVNHYHGQETVAVYCNADGGINVWTASNWVGYFAFTATQGEVAGGAVKPLKNTLIKSDLGIALYRLTTGELQINAANGFVFVWNECLAM